MYIIEGMELATHLIEWYILEKINEWKLLISAVITAAYFGGKKNNCFQEEPEPVELLKKKEMNKIQRVNIWIYFLWFI